MYHKNMHFLIPAVWLIRTWNLFFFLFCFFHSDTLRCCSDRKNSFGSEFSLNTYKTSRYAVGYCSPGVNLETPPLTRHFGVTGCQMFCRPFRHRVEVKVGLKTKLLKQ